MDSSLATSYAFGITSATIIGVGFEKVDVTAVTDFQISARGTVPNSGGRGNDEEAAVVVEGQEVHEGYGGAVEEIANM